MALNISGPMESIEITLDVILDAMMKKLTLPCPEYKSSRIRSDFFQTEVLFYPSAHFLQSSLPPHSIQGSPAMSLEASKKYAAAAAIEYMATDQKKVVKDYNYDELQKQKEINKRLDRKLWRKHEKLAKRTDQLRKSIVASDILIDKVSNSAEHIQEILSKSLSSGHVNVHANHDTAFLDMQNVAAELRCHKDEALNSLKDTGAYPLHEYLSRDNASYDASTDREDDYDASTDREDDQYYCDDHCYDSDGDELCEEEMLRYRND